MFHTPLFTVSVTHSCTDPASGMWSGCYMILLGSISKPFPVLLFHFHVSRQTGPYLLNMDKLKAHKGGEAVIKTIFCCQLDSPYHMPRCTQNSQRSVS
jgi:hypothetical protein